MGWGAEWVVAMVLMKLVALQAQETPPPPPSSSVGAIALPNCQWECGGVRIPYPFGIGENCSHPSSPDFRVNCLSNKPMLADDNGELKYEVIDISLLDSTVRVSTTTPPTCKSIRTYELLWSTRSLRLAPSANVLAVLGCDVLAFFYGSGYYVNASSGSSYTYVNQTVGCVSTCLASEADRRSQPVEIGVCKDGCCQTSVDIPAWSYYTIGSKIDKSNLMNLSVVRERFYAFVVEKGTFNFSGAKDIVSRGENITTILVAEWSIGVNMSSYACASNNSESVNSTIWEYTCRCKNGYEGNPYLKDGCRGNTSPIKLS